MRADHSTQASSSIGALTRKDRYREATLRRKIDDAYRDVATTHSPFRRKRHLRAARRHERALLAQRRRPQSALVAFAFGLVALLGALVATRAPASVAAVTAGLLALDLVVLRVRRRRLRRP